MEQFQVLPKNALLARVALRKRQAADRALKFGFDPALRRINPDRLPALTGCVR